MSSESQSTSPRRNGLATRVALLEQRNLSLTEDMRELRLRQDRFSAFVFGDESNVDSMKSQVKQISAVLEQLVTSINKAEQERMADNQRLNALETWKQQRESVLADNKKERQQVRYTILAAVISTPITFVLGWIMARIFGG